MPIFLSRVVSVILVAIVSVGLLSIYILQLAETNEYLGYTNFDIDFYYICAVILSLGCCGLIMPVNIEKPSDLLFLVYGLFVLLPYAILFPIRQEISVQDFSIYFFTLAFPLIVVKLTALKTPATKFPVIMDPATVVWIISLLCISGVGLALWNAPSAAAFDIAGAYERRIEGRDIFATGSPLAYLNAAVANGFAPFLGFIAGYRKNNKFLVLALLCGLIYFYILGLKAPLFYIILAFVIGRVAFSELINWLAIVIYIIILGSIAVFAIEYMFFDYSLVADYLLRRAFSVPPYVVSAYFEFMNSDVDWELMGGADQGQPITFVIGERVLGSPETNANTNAFLYQLGAGGIPMYVLTILLVALVFAILDSAYANKRTPVLLYLAFSYSILIVEQAATTALASSGLGVLMVLAVLSSPADLPADQQDCTEKIPLQV